MYRFRFTGLSSTSKNNPKPFNEFHTIHKTRKTLHFIQDIFFECHLSKNFMYNKINRIGRWVNKKKGSSDGLKQILFAQIEKN